MNPSAFYNFILAETATSVISSEMYGPGKRLPSIPDSVQSGLPTKRNGTASIFHDRDYAFTFSLHQMDIYPAEKPRSSLDVGLWSGDGDDEYLSALGQHFPRLYEEFKPDLVYYLAGADPFENDQLGELEITHEGLQERDRIVIENARRLELPLVIVLAGGYASDIEDTVTAHMNTISVAQKVERSLSRRFAKSRPRSNPDTSSSPAG